MPSLIRFLMTIGVLAGLTYAAMFALVLYVEPREREVTVRVPTNQIELKRITPDNSGAATQPVAGPSAADETPAGSVQ